jgi:amino acid transporter
MMGSSMVNLTFLFPYVFTDTSFQVLAASRQSFAFARDGALPLSSILYRMNDFTGTPVNTVWFVAAISTLLGLLSLAGTQAINAVFALSVTGLYVAYSIPIAARFIFKNNFKPGPFNLGIFVSSSRDVHTRDPR